MATSTNSRPKIALWNVSGVLAVSLFILLFSAFVTNPGIDSFRRYRHGRTAQSGGPLGAIISNFDLWLSTQIGMVEVKNYGIASLVKGKAMLGSRDDCGFLGVFHTWIPLCWNLSYPSCKDIGGCHGRGICVSTNSCLCLPGSKTDESCSSHIVGFEPFNMFGLLPSTLSNFSVLELLIIAMVLSQLILWIRPSAGKRLIASWNAIVVHKYIWTLVTSPLFHHNFPHLLYNIYGFYSYAPAIYSLTREILFVQVCLMASLLGIVSGLVANRITGCSEDVVLGMSPLLVCFKTFFICAVSSGKSWVLPEITRMVFAHLITEYIFLGSQINFTASMSGIISGYVFFRSTAA